MGDTTIEWTNKTWNPIRGCSRVSEGCRNCYAERVAARFGGPGLPYEGLTTKDGRWNGKVVVVEEHLADPLRWKKPRRIFVNSMSDLFHENVSDETIDQIFSVMVQCPQHIFQVLTKRPERMQSYMESCQMGADDVGGRFPWDNVWLGVSVEDQKSADERIPHLLRTPAAVRWLSVEPMLGPVDLAKAGWNFHDFDPEFDVQIQWVVCGGESGAGARPMHPAWARSLRDQCVAAGTPFFMKQMDKKQPIPEDLLIREYPHAAR